VFDIASWFENSSALVGLLLIGGIIFAESGLLIGFFLPGDTLLFTAGFFAAQGHFPLAAVLSVIFAAAVIGDNVGYYIGKKSGPRLFKKQDGVIFRQEYVQRAEKFYEKHGGKTIIIARFVPIVRTFAPVVAGVGNMDRKTFFLYNLVGGFVWTVSLVMLGYWLGDLVPAETVEKYLLLIIGAAMALSFGPMLYHLFQAYRENRHKKVN